MQILNVRFVSIENEAGRALLVAIVSLDVAAARLHQSSRPTAKQTAVQGTPNRPYPTHPPHHIVSILAIILTIKASKQATHTHSFDRFASLPLSVCLFVCLSVCLSEHRRALGMAQRRLGNSGTRK
jgi:lipopolysaccharide export LptBFGC system permease protein LptF